MLEVDQVDFCQIFYDDKHKELSKNPLFQGEKDY